MTSASVLRVARETSGLTKRGLARLAATSAPALVEYERGRRDPGAETIDRLLLAAGRGPLRFDPSVRRVDPVRNSRRLVQVLELAEHLPRRPAARTLSAPRLPHPR